MNKKDALPIVVASIIALVITILVKWMLPSSSGPANQAEQGISMPDIPLAVKSDARKSKRKKDNNFVLFVARSFKKDEKIILDKLKWEKWPADAMQSYFIAKDHADTPLNNGADYSNALKMWAKNDIPDNVPLTMSMLTNEDPQKRKAAEQKKKEEEAKKKLEKEKKEEFIGKGMRAVTFPIDQRSATSTNMMRPGDLVDVLIMVQNGDKKKTYKYKALKILAIDGITKFDSEKPIGQNSGGFLGNVGGIVSGLTTPKNVTLEVKEELVEIMLSQSSTNGLILSVRGQNEKVSEKDEDAFVGESSSEFDHVLRNILKMNDGSPSSVQQADYTESLQEEKNMAMIMNNILSINSKNTGNEAPSNGSTNVGGKGSSSDAGEQSSSNTKSNSGQYEVVSGKIIGEEDREAEIKTATIYRKLTASRVEFDENGKLADTNGSGGSFGGGASGGGR